MSRPYERFQVLGWQASHDFGNCLKCFKEISSGPTFLCTKNMVCHPGSSKLIILTFWPGPIVRIAPEEVSIDDPEDSLRIIYGHGTKFVKVSNFDYQHVSPSDDTAQSRWYEASDAPGQHSIFTDANLSRHAHERRMVANSFSMTSLMGMESFVDDCVRVLESRFEDFAINASEIDIGHWLQCYAFDVIGGVTVC